MQQARDYLTELYLDYVNNYLTIERFAEHNGITPAQARDLITVARNIFETPHPEA